MENNQKIGYLFCCIWFSCYHVVNAQFAPAAGQMGSTAIHKDDPSIIAWADACAFNAGWVHIQDTSLGKVSDTGCQAGLGPAGDGSIISLGDGGSITLSFSQAIVDRDGFDFAIFENSFNDTYLEMAHVEASDDGLHFVRFPSTSLTDTSTQVGPFGAVDPTKIHNLAGKYRANYGTPFDLAELADSSIDIQSISHIRIIDVIGSIDQQIGSSDQYGNLINDPYPTPFPSSGFDLDAVAVINNGTNSISNLQTRIKLYPNPVHPGHVIHVQSENQIQAVRLISMLGQTYSLNSLAPIQVPSDIPVGIYHIELTFESYIRVQKICIN